MTIKTITIDTDTHVVVPRVPTVSNEMKRRFIGEYCWQEEAPYYDENGVLHDNMATREIPWDMCKKIYKEMAAHWIATAPQPEQAQQSDDLTIAYMAGLHDGRKQAAPRPVPTSDRLPFIIDVGFRYENGFHTPTVLLGFSVDDWKARDAFVRDSGLVRPAEVKP